MKYIFTFEMLQLSVCLFFSIKLDMLGTCDRTTRCSLKRLAAALFAVEPHGTNKQEVLLSHRPGVAAAGHLLMLGRPGLPVHSI